MNILLIGGTGAIGIPLIDILCQSGHNVYITSRRERINGERKTFIQWDGRDNEQLKNIAKICHWDVIVDFLVYSTNIFHDHIQAIISHTKQYIFVSSARVFAESKGFLTEQSPRLLDTSTDDAYLATDEYALCKARCENILRKYDNYTIVRPSITFNENRLQLGIYEIEH